MVRIFTSYEGRTLAIALTLGVAASAFGTWDRDDTLIFKNAVAAAYASSAGRLAADTYYVRGQVVVGQTGTGDPDRGKYHLEFPSGTGPVYIQGAEPASGSAALIDRLQTRIVHGVIVGDKDDDSAWLATHSKEIQPWSALPSNDPWLTRFIRANTANLCWVEFPSDPLYSIDPASHAFGDISADGNRNWPTCTYKGIPLHIAEAVESSANGGYRWTWMNPNTTTEWTQQTSGLGNQSIVHTDLGFVAEADWTNDYTWGITFHGWDANCGMTKVNALQSTTEIELPSGNWVCDSTITFKNNPWNASTGGTNTDLSKVRRVTLINAPEFLQNPGDMVFNPATRRIYFLCPPTSFNRGGVTAPDPNLEANKFMEISWPLASNNSGRNWGAPLVIGNGTATQNRQVIIKDIVFGTGRGMSIDMKRIEGTAANPIKIENCRFRNQGHVGVSLQRCKNVQIDGCSFEDGLRGHLKIDAGRNFTQPYDTESSPPISDVKDLVSDGIIVTNSGFYNGGLMWPYNGTVEMANWNIGTDISHNTFGNLSGIAVRIHGATNIVQFNDVHDCVKDITDYGAIYCGRSLVQLGNLISGNTINGVKWRGRTSQAKTPNSLEDDVCGVYVDDYMCGTTVGENLFSDCQTGIMSNGGRFNLFYRNWFDSNVEYVLRTNVARGVRAGSSGFSAAYLDTGTFRYWFESDYYKRSVVNQLYSEMRNLYMACKAAYPNEEVFENTAWTAVQNTGAYQISYHPVGEPDTKDLKHLVMRLNTSATGQPTWAASDANAYYHDGGASTGPNALRRIQYGTPVADWFKSATEATGVSGVPNRTWLVDYTSTNKTILKNYGNAWVWCTDNFADLNKRPVTQHRVFFRSYRDSQPASEEYMADEVGYYSFEVPNTNGND